MQTTADLLHCILTAQPASTFHKISVHAAMTPADIEGYLRSAFDKADVLKVSYEKKVSQQDHQEKPIGTNQRTQTLGLQLMLSSLLHANREYSMRSAALSDVDL